MPLPVVCSPQRLVSLPRLTTILPGQVLEEEWGRIKEAENIETVFEEKESSLNENTPATGTQKTSIESVQQATQQFQHRMLEGIEQQRERELILKLKTDVQQEHKTKTKNLITGNFIGDQGSTPKWATSNEVKLATPNPENTLDKSIDQALAPLDILANEANSMHQTKPEIKTANIGLIKDLRGRVAMTDDEMNEAINTAVETYGRETRIEGMQSTETLSKEYEAEQATPIRKPPPKVPEVNVPTPMLMKPQMLRQHTVRHRDNLGINIPRTTRTNIVWLWGSDIDYVKFKASEYYKNQYYAGGVPMTFFWGPTSKIGDDKHDGTGRKWWDGYNQQNTVVINDLEADMMPLLMMIDLIGERQYILHRRGLPDGKNFNSRLLIVTSKVEPNELYKMQGSQTQRWTLKNRLLEFGNQCKYICNPLY